MDLYALLYSEWITNKVQHMELCSVLCGLDGKGVWRRMDTYICIAESFHYSLESITTLLIGYTPIKNKKLKKKKVS